ncbi:retrovirus-related pol polyprotein from transposon TNT 1-94 [Tanacetum coccineum]
MILSDADNRPPMLDKNLYDSWKSRMEFYMQNREHERMILESVEHADCDMKATNIILQGLPADIYSLVNHHRVAKDLWERVQLMQGFVVPVFSPGDDSIACLNKAMAFLTAVASSRFPSTNNQLITSYNPRNQANIQDDRIQDLADQLRTIIPHNVLSELRNLGYVPHFKPYHTDMDNKSVHAMQGFELTPVVDFIDNEITSDRNIITYSQYLQETQQAAVQDTNLYAQQDSMILSVIEQITREKMIDSQMDDMIKENLSLKQQIDPLEQNLSNQIKENESLLQTFTVFKNESKEKESKYMDKKIDLEKKIKELDNIVYKVALGYQNPFYLKKAQRIKPTLYDGSVISSQHAASLVIDDEETLILEEVSRSKMLAKQNDPMSKEKKVNTTPINYVELNRLFEDFAKRFVPQQYVFAWTHADIIGIPRTIMIEGKPFKTEHKLNEYSHIKLIKQKRQGLGPDRNTSACKEVEELTKAGILQKVKHHTWVANPFMIQKSNGRWRMVSIEMFLDAYKGYHHIQMAEGDEDKTNFFIGEGVFCYQKMPFGLKNAGATYQRLVDKVFHDQIRRNLEAYVDDMAIKSTSE